MFFYFKKTSDFAFTTLTMLHSREEVVDFVGYLGEETVAAGYVFKDDIYEVSIFSPIS